MANLEERIAVVEAQSDVQARAIDAFRAEIAALRNDMRAETAALRAELLQLRDEMSRRFDMMDQKFLWLAGTQVATLLAVVGVLAGVLYR